MNRTTGKPICNVAKWWFYIQTCETVLPYRQMASQLQQLHNEFLYDLEIGEGRSSLTVKVYDQHLRRFFRERRIVDVSDIDADAVRLHRRQLYAAGLAPPTVNQHLIALRQFLKYLAVRDITALSPTDISLAKVPEPAVDVLYSDEIDLLLEAPTRAAADSEDAGKLTPPQRLRFLRDAAILHTLFSTGVRVSELRGLNRDQVRDNRSLVIRGKGSRVRTVYLSPMALEVGRAYVTARDDTDPALFIRHNANLRLDKDRRLGVVSIERMIQKYAVLAGLQKHVSPHTLRHSFGTDLLRNGANSRQVQLLLGHKSIQTTQRYTHMTDAHLRDVHKRYHRLRKSE